MKNDIWRIAQTTRWIGYGWGVHPSVPWVLATGLISAKAEGRTG